MSPLPLLRAGDSLLLIVDVQTRVAAALPSVEWARVRDRIAALAHAAGILALPTIACRQGTAERGRIAPEIEQALPDHAQQFDRSAFDATRCEPLRAGLEMAGRSQVLVCGLEAHLAVLQTVAGLEAAGYQPFVAADAVAARAPEDRETALTRLRAGGIPLLGHESAIGEWLGDSGHPAFETLAAPRT